MSTISSAEPLAPFSRPLRAEIDLDALRWNLRQLSSVLRNGTQILAVIKANAYGHGAFRIAQAILDTEHSPSAVRMLGVASVDEGLQLRQIGIQIPILLLSAIMPDEAAAAVRADLIPTVYTAEVATAVNEAAMAQNCVATVHVKVDTGMGRLGVWHGEAAAFYRSLLSLTHLRVTGIYTHFACADEADDAMTPVQQQAFERALRECGLQGRNGPPGVTVHAANSAALLRYPQAHFDLVRPGLACYGVLPSAHVQHPGVRLRPVMSLKARVTDVRTVPVGATISYGATWRAPRNSRLAVVPVGYADGYPRCLSNRGQVLIRDTCCPVTGRVTMDQILVDCTHLVPNVQVGESVTLFGEGLPVEDVAAWAGTIPYEILCGIAHRVPRVYTDTSN